jgi:hypothetical protein
MRARHMYVEMDALKVASGKTTPQSTTSSRQRRSWLFGQWTDNAGGNYGSASTRPPVPPPTSAYPQPTPGYGGPGMLHSHERYTYSSSSSS